MLEQLERMADWVRASDAHAPQRLVLLRRAQRVLAGAEPAETATRRQQADALERWRYQHLKHHGASLAGADRELADTLDLLANALVGHARRSARSPRAALKDRAFEPPQMAEALACLDPRAPLQGVASRAEELTRSVFSAEAPGGTSRRRMLLYAPLYLSSHCVNYCMYCGFRYPLATPRRHLELSEAVRQSELLRGRGLRHVLLVAGDFPKLTSIAYYTDVLRAIAKRGVLPSVEFAPQSTEGYRELVAAGAIGVTLYQETYQETLYTSYHPRGTKASFDWRLEGPERAAEAGVSRLGLGVLLGLADPRTDLIALARHAEYLRARYPQCTLLVSLPRIHQAPPEFDVPYPVDDETFVRLYCALRIAFPTAELVLSTRESPELRNRLAAICITQMSAGSSTIPGGYEPGDAVAGPGEQFPVVDHRSVAEVRQWLQQEGFEPVWKT